MSAGELIAWQAGVDWFRAGLSSVDWNRMTDVRRRAMLGPDACRALDELGGLVFAYWFGAGMVDGGRTAKG